MRACKLLIADDQDIMCYALKRLFAKERDMDICGVAKDGDELLELARALRPDVILTDMRMGGMPVVEVTKILKKEKNRAYVMVFSSYDDDEYVMSMLAEGVRGYVLKNEQTNELPIAVRSVSNGEVYFSAAINFKQSQQDAKDNPYRIPEKLIELNKRDLNIINMVCRGLTSKEMGDELCLSSRTAEGCIDRLMKKIGVSKQLGLVMYAIKHKLYVIDDRYGEEGGGQTTDH